MNINIKKNGVEYDSSKSVLTECIPAGEKVARVHFVIAQKVERGPVKLVCSRAGHRVHNAAHLPSILGVERTRLDTDFLDSIGIRVWLRNVGVAVVVIRVIQQEVRRVAARAVDRNR